jgi:hypothetical protein
MIGMSGVLQQTQKEVPWRQSIAYRDRSFSSALLAAFQPQDVFSITGYLLNDLLYDEFYIVFPNSLFCCLFYPHLYDAHKDIWYFHTPRCNISFPFYKH